MTVFLENAGDAPADITTSYIMAPGDDFEGVLDPVGERDWIAIQLVAGLSYRFDLRGTGDDPLEDPYLRLWDSDGAALLGFNDNSVLGGLDSKLIYYASTSGTHYLSAGSAGDGFAGGYTLSVVFHMAGNDDLVGTERDDTIDLDWGDDRYDGLGGNDKVKGGAGNDTLLGSDGDDKLEGGGDDDLLEGGAGNDTLLGGSGDDRILGGDGDDQLRGGRGDDRMSGGDGDDSMRAEAGDDVMLGGSGNDFLRGNGGSDRVMGGEGDDTVLGDSQDDILHGNAGNDVLGGGNGDDRLLGGAGDDVLNGGRGDDMLMGNAGADTLDGGAGNDALTGGGGADIFVFATGSDQDTITDFEDGIDLIDISGFDPAVIALVSDPSYVETILAGASTVIASGSDALAIENNSSVDITLTADDFIW